MILTNAGDRYRPASDVPAQLGIHNRHRHAGTSRAQADAGSQRSTATLQSDRLDCRRILGGLDFLDGQRRRPCTLPIGRYSLSECR